MPRFVNIDDFRVAARRRLPRVVFDFLDGGAHSESSLRANRSAFEQVTFRPRVLVDVDRCDLATQVLGEPLALPLVLAPIGLAGLFAPRAEAVAIRAAEDAGIVGCLSTSSVCSIEEVKAAVTRPFWFQLYVMKDRGFTRALLERAMAAGCTTLVVTVDLPVQGQRDRDARNGFSVPPRITPGNALDMLVRVRWVRDVLAGPTLTFGNLGALAPGRSDLMSLAAHIAKTLDASVTWTDLDWIRSIWRGKVVLKGILEPDDVRLAIEHGVDGVIVSNHGGRQLDGAPATIDALPAVVDAAAGRLEVLLDGGIRRGADVIKALALGARACLVGRAWAYAVAADGPAGVSRAIEILAKEMATTLALLGRPGVGLLDADAVRRVTAGR